MSKVIFMIGIVALAGACAEQPAELADDGTDGKADDGASQCRLNDSIRETARTFLFDSGVGSRSDEVEVIDGIFTRWGAVKAVRANDASRACLIVMNLQMQIELEGQDPILELGDRWEVVAFSTTTKRVSLFESAIAVPPAIQFGFSFWRSEPTENGEEMPDDLFYAELAGDDALDAYKAALAGIGYSGLAADISAKNVQAGPDGATLGEPDGKLDFDPTPGRTWKLANATFDLSRGSSAEIHDVRAGQLDEDFEAFFSGSSGHVAPWNFGGVRRWRAAGDTTWTELELTIDR